MSAARIAAASGARSSLGLPDVSLKGLYHYLRSQRRENVTTRFSTGSRSAARLEFLPEIRCLASALGGGAGPSGAIHRH
jgi:hypothetical protein